MNQHLRKTRGFLSRDQFHSLFRVVCILKGGKNECKINSELLNHVTQKHCSLLKIQFLKISDFTNDERCENYCVPKTTRANQICCSTVLKIDPCLLRRCYLSDCVSNSELDFLFGCHSIRTRLLFALLSTQIRNKSLEFTYTNS